jgi:hypothetical protein
MEKPANQRKKEQTIYNWNKEIESARKDKQNKNEKMEKQTNKKRV